MEKVESKYKNPDKYVEKLKVQIQELKHKRNFWRVEHDKVKGQSICSYKDDTIWEVSSTDKILTKFNVDDIIILRGIIKEVFSNRSGSLIKYDHLKIRKKETP